ncbi:histidine phosphatase family protein [Elioraea thermophila]|uniref:histidine phosphatase family protein n=1 Tax=Elioraea thermophila TaxID=2185104 RepID=UPI000DF12EDF|nr:histidine phosphatase family protein [Elioraea thermophila]
MRRRALLAAALFLALVPDRGRAAPFLGDLRAGRAALLMRHALAPGTGDPPGFRLDDCATQRNLSERGRAQARAWGEALRTMGLERATVLSSAWCRCRETAELLGLGPVAHHPALDSFFADRAREAERTAALRSLLRDWRGGALVLVTHQVNITALTRLVPAQGGAVVVRTGERAGEVVATIDPPPV